MKQVEVTSEILSLLRQAVGTDADLSNLAVYEAIALNTLPLRKKHPLYDKAVTSRGTLKLMADAVNKESLPLQIMHDGGDLPSGRIFHGTVVDTQTDSELRVLFWVDKTNTDLVSKIESGTIDQVSVSVLAEKVLCSECNFDYFGPDATFDHIWTGTCPEGHALGENGVHTRLVGLDSWFEMSLVGKGGAQNARIVSKDNSVFGSNFQRLAASGLDPNSMVLTAVAKKKELPMDLKALVDQLTSSTAELTTAKATVTTLEAKVTGLETQVAELTTKLTEAGDVVKTLAAKDTEIASLTASNSKAIDSLKDIAKTILVATGNVNPEIPADLDQIIALISDTGKGLAAALVAGGKSKDPIADIKTVPARTITGFRVNR